MRESENSERIIVAFRVFLKKKNIYVMTFQQWDSIWKG